MADIKYAEIIEVQRKHFYELADKLIRQEPLDELDRMRCGAVLRSYAKQMSTARPRPAGRPSKLPGELAHLVGFRILDGESQNQAIEYYAEKYDVSITAVKNELKKQGFKDVLDDMKTWVRK